uniref:ATP synthase F0 subunit 8 n=1 Tax=Japanagallia malaisei TaxID=3071385 RepID=A0AA51BSJ6_9HEMI|nr:ATP synthase F0 subunit 8 [Japanagallia malaisei]WMI45369.1 ATP synthase F0 subunit 8 [Japanagallia malaisei]
MPQMAPMWWLTLSVLFNINMMITISTIYFNKNILMKNYLTFKKKNLNWKW